MTSIFDIPKHANDLKNSHPNLARAAFRQITANRDITGDNFSQGNIQFNWKLGGTTWFLPSMSYFRIRCTLTQVRANNWQLMPIIESSELSPNMGLAANLFQSVEVRLNGTPIERIGARLPQVDALKTRMNKSKAWLDSVGASVNFWDYDHNRRKQNCAINGYMAQSSGAGQAEYGRSYDGNAFGMQSGINQVQYAANTNLLTFVVNGGADIDLSRRQVLRSGDLILLGPVQLEVVNAISPLIALVRPVGGAGNADVGLDTLAHNHFSVKPIAHSSNNAIIPKNSFEIIWQPPLGFFELTHAIPPGGDWVVEFSPESVAYFKKRAIESLTHDLTPATISGAGSVETNFNFSVDQMFLFLYTLESERFDNGSYLLDLKKTQCQVTTMMNDSTALTQKDFSVHENTTALILAFQDQLSGVDTRYSASKFKLRNNRASPDGQELLLSRFYISYNNLQQPSPDFDGGYKFDPRSSVTQSQFLAHRYVDTLLQSNGYHTEGGAETLSDYLARGMFHYFTWPKDSDEKPTRVNVNYQFSAPFGQGEQPHILLFHQWSSTFRITHKNGRVDPASIKEL
jgi:hypothetical protein